MVAAVVGAASGGFPLVWCQAAISNVDSERGWFAAWSLGSRPCWKEEGNEVGGREPGWCWCRVGPWLSPLASLPHTGSEAVLSVCFPACILDALAAQNSRAKCPMGERGC